VDCFALLPWLPGRLNSRVKDLRSTSWRFSHLSLRVKAGTYGSMAASRRLNEIWKHLMYRWVFTRSLKVADTHWILWSKSVSDGRHYSVLSAWSSCAYGDDRMLDQPRSTYELRYSISVRIYRSLSKRPWKGVSPS
jgi:hypothetical protein